MMKDLATRLVVDVGAYQGGYGLEIRHNGYRGAILSFEPLNQAYEKLALNAAKDGNWRAEHMALGDSSGEMAINVSGHASSSSLLGMTELHRKACPGSAYVSTETVRIDRLDNVLDRARVEAERGWLRIDVQGFEKHVLEGTGPLISKFAGIEVELSLTAVYEGAPLIEDVLVYFRERKFRPVSFENAFVDPENAEVLQVNVIFTQ